MFDLKLNDYTFHQLGVVGRGSETQLQMDDDVNQITECVKVWLNGAILSIIYFSVKSFD